VAFVRGAGRLDGCFVRREDFAEDDARTPPDAGVRFAVADAPFCEFLGAMSP
jgi:hypothetical protein